MVSCEGDGGGEAKQVLGTVEPRTLRRLAREGEVGGRGWGVGGAGGGGGSFCILLNAGGLRGHRRVAAHWLNPIVEAAKRSTGACRRPGRKHSLANGAAAEV